MPFDFEEFPSLHTTRLDLTEIEAAHTVDLYNLFTDKQVTKHYPVIPLTGANDLLPVIARFQDQFANRQGIRWGLALKDQKNIIGTIGITVISKSHRAAIQFALMPEYWRKGYIAEAIKEVTNFGFNSLGIHRIEAEVKPGNIASEKALMKCGFTFEALLREWMLWEGVHYDINIYSILSNHRK